MLNINKLIESINFDLRVHKDYLKEDDNTDFDYDTGYIEALESVLIYIKNH